MDKLLPIKNMNVRLRGPRSERLVPIGVVDQASIDSPGLNLNIWLNTWANEYVGLYNPRDMVETYDAESGFIIMEQDEDFVEWFKTKIIPQLDPYEMNMRLEVD